ncbi:M67 family metallopeptidase [Scytonema hofmannii FACHB-248]|uniref:M67 family metallopeptidase n=1 Tax=Scytonema hofmannii FACHB-248 TaxID=1842502 RepID=A0ABR8H021_9CYAN|nr:MULTISPECIES: M67 family metallopeptidase [Nostocales]MBD2608601.1 M67 family metallopeptidase [Scytonema hofmannii FACHB-248]
MLLKLSQQHLQIIRTHAASTYPEECCGIILGYLANESKSLVEVIPTENAWSEEDSKKRRYAIAPEIMLKVQKQARDRSLSIIGIYHSHPDYPAIPSESDRTQAWQEYSYIIVSVPNGKALELKSWHLDDNHQFQEEAIEIV